MDYLWTPWRYQYMAQVTAGKQPECIFCDAVALHKDDETLIAYRGAKTFIILNRFPYTSGHVMIVPYAHVAELNLCDSDALSRNDAASPARRKSLPSKLQARWHESRHEPRQSRRRRRSRPLHLHVLPRWFGDSNFMTVTAETRVHPEDLHVTYERLRKALAG